MIPELICLVFFLDKNEAQRYGSLILFLMMIALSETCSNNFTSTIG